MALYSDLGIIPYHLVLPATIHGAMFHEFTELRTRRISTSGHSPQEEEIKRLLLEMERNEQPEEPRIGRRRRSQRPQPDDPVDTAEGLGPARTETGTGRQPQDVLDQLNLATHGRFAS